jgi:hypothetical protein
LVRNGTRNHYGKNALSNKLFYHDSLEASKINVFNELQTDEVKRNSKFRNAIKQLAFEVMFAKP